MAERPSYKALEQKIGALEEEAAKGRWAAEALKESEKQLCDLADNSLVGVYRTNLQGDILSVNKALAKMLEFESPEEMMSENVLARYGNPRDRNIFIENLKKSGRVTNFSFELKTKTGNTKKGLLSAALEEETISGMIVDITDLDRAREQLVYETCHDKLTGLPNRALFVDRLEQTIRHSRRRKDALFAVTLLDLNRFRAVNVGLGHRAGDRLIIEMARRLEGCLRGGDTVARIGGDEFVILLQDIEDVTDTIRVAERIEEALAVPVNLNGQQVCMSASMGIVLSAPDYDQAEDMLRDADIALHRAQSSGTACHEVFDRAMHERAVARLQLENDLRLAVEREEFRVHYQPIVSLGSGRIIGLEALVRWQHPKRGLVPPMEFIPLAEETGLILPMGFWVLREACVEMREELSFSGESPVLLSVNLSAKQFSQADLVDQIQRILRESGVEAGSVMLEITESVVMEHAEFAAAALTQLKTLGVQLSIDDFGTGYSSLSCLHSYPIDTLKIDRSFVGKMGMDTKNMEIVRTIVALAENLGMHVTAEGIETAEQLAQLRGLQCECGQGYLFSKPLEADAIEQLLSSKPKW
jgi:diguanylate cyclase (GGDEF)-like protein/PAS domain S-box-containing protein